jgi:general secretion pathway protein D
VAEEISVFLPTNSASRDAYPASTPVTNQVPIGSKVDIYPFVGADGFTIQLTVSASTTEFLGYDDPGQFVPQADSDGSDKPHKAVLPLPRVRVLHMPTHSAVVWDGQTLVLGRSEQIDTNQIPVFGGDRPQLGRLFRSEPKDKDFIIFITPTIIDPAGNRVHSADEIPGPIPKSR